MWAHDWRRFVPETALLCAAIVAVDICYFGDTRFADWQYSPLWIPVLLAACQYGVIGGAFAAGVASLALYAGALPAQGAHQDFYDYASRLALQPTAWFGVALALGSLRSLHIQKAVKADNALREGADHLSHVVLSLKRATSEIASLESRIASDTATVNRLLRGVAGVEFASSERLADSVAALISDTLAASSFTLYLRTDGGLEPILLVDEEGVRAGGPAAISPAALEAMTASHRAISRADGVAAAMLPAGALVLAPVTSAGGTTHGALLIERVRTPANIPALTERTTILANAIATLFEMSAHKTALSVVSATLGRFASAAGEA
jgi:hypothetical protein